MKINNVQIKLMKIVLRKIATEKIIIMTVITVENKKRKVLQRK